MLHSKESLQNTTFVWLERLLREREEMAEFVRTLGTFVIFYCGDCAALLHFYEHPSRLSESTW